MENKPEQSAAGSSQTPKEPAPSAAPALPSPAAPSSLGAPPIAASPPTQSESPYAPGYVAPSHPAPAASSPGASRPSIVPDKSAALVPSYAGSGHPETHPHPQPQPIGMPYAAPNGPVYAQPIHYAPQSNPPQRPSTAQEFMKYFSIIAALLIVAGTTLALYSFNAVRDAAGIAATVFQPQIKYSTVLSGAIGELQNSAKLVVLTANLQATVDQESDTSVAGFSVATAKVHVTAPAKVQFYVNLKDLSLNDLVYDEANKRFVVTIPRPILDRDLVDVESDPEKVQVKIDYGWNPMTLLQTDGLRKGAMRHMRNAALEQGGHELLIERANANAKEKVGELLGKVKDALRQDGVRLDVEFKK